MITQANGFTKMVVHNPSYSSNGWKFSHFGNASISTLFSSYILMALSLVGLHKIFSVSVLPEASSLMAFLFSSVNVLVQPVSITKLNTNNKIFAVFLFFVLHSFYQRLNQMAIIAPFDLT